MAYKFRLSKITTFCPKGEGPSINGDLGFFGDSGKVSVSKLLSGLNNSSVWSMILVPGPSASRLVFDLFGETRFLGVRFFLLFVTVLEDSKVSKLSNCSYDAVAILPLKTFRAENTYFRSTIKLKSHGRTRYRSLTGRVSIWNLEISQNSHLNSTT